MTKFIAFQLQLPPVHAVKVGAGMLITFTVLVPVLADELFIIVAKLIPFNISIPPLAGLAVVVAKIFRPLVVPVKVLLVDELSVKVILCSEPVSVLPAV